MEFPDFVQLATDSLTLTMGGLFLLATGFFFLDRHEVRQGSVSAVPHEDREEEFDEDRRAA